MTPYHKTLADIASALHRVNGSDLLGFRGDPEAEAARLRFHCHMARRRRRDAVLAYLREPWSAWSADGDAARTARRFLTRHPDFDWPDPAYDLLTDRQAATEYHRDEAANDTERSEDPPWR